MENWILQENIGGCNFRIFNPETKEHIYFTAEYKNGTYCKVLSAWKTDGRVYQAQRYLYKYIHIAQEYAFELLKSGELWDYNNQVPALESYKKDIKPYYEKCKKLELSIEPFLCELFEEV